MLSLELYPRAMSVFEHILLLVCFSTEFRKEKNYDDYSVSSVFTLMVDYKESLCVFVRVPASDIQVT